MIDFSYIYFLFIGLFIVSLIRLAIIDARTFLLPDIITLPLIFLGILFNCLFENSFTSSFNSIIGSFIGFILIWLLNKLYLILRGHHGIGMGDAKLLAGLGAILGWQDLFICLLIASLLGIVGGFIWLKFKGFNLSNIFPFGPYLATSGILFILLRFSDLRIPLIDQ
jgi:prepilin signal peptidase PulO-like enzyme (type II secretory pathway)